MIGVGIIGLGTVGLGTFNILTEGQTLIKERTGLDIRVVRIAEVDPKKTKGKGIPAGILTKSAEELIEDKNVHIVGRNRPRRGIYHERP
jgi:homoserine dehydrogenase